MISMSRWRLLLVSQTIRILEQLSQSRSCWISDEGLLETLGLQFDVRLTRRSDIGRAFGIPPIRSRCDPGHRKSSKDTAMQDRWAMSRPLEEQDQDRLKVHPKSGLSYWPMDPQFRNLVRQRIHPTIKGWYVVSDSRKGLVDIFAVSTRRTGIRDQFPRQFEKWFFRPLWRARSGHRPESVQTPADQGTRLQEWESKNA